MSDPVKRDCIHGCLGRSCHVCELEADLKAAVARAEKAEAELLTWLTPLREAFGLVSTLAPHRIVDPSHPIDWAKGIVRDVEAERDALRMAGVDPRYEAMRQRAEKAEYQIKVLRDLADIDTEARDNVTAERDRLAAQVKAMQETTTFKLEDYDRLAGIVERAGNLTRYRADIGVRMIDAVDVDDLRRALAVPVEGTFTRRGDGTIWSVSEQRGTTGHDARGRRQYDPRVTIYTASDRRRAQRRRRDESISLL